MFLLNILEELIEPSRSQDEIGEAFIIALNSIPDSRLFMECGLRKEDVFRIESLCAKYGEYPFLVLISWLRKKRIAYKGHAPKFAEMFSLLKNIVAKSIEIRHSARLNLIKKPLRSEKRIMFLMPMLPGNINNNISNLILGYVAELNRLKNVSAKLVITGELNLDEFQSNLWFAASRPAHKKIIEKYQGSSDEIVYLSGTAAVTDEFLEFINNYDPQCIVVPNYELICSYALLAKAYCPTFFMQTSIKNIPPYEYKNILICGEVSELQFPVEEGVKVIRHVPGYPKFGFTEAKPTVQLEQKKEVFRIVFASNRVEGEISLDYLKRLQFLMSKHAHVEFSILGVKDNKKLIDFMLNVFSADEMARVHLYGYIEDIGNFFENCEVYLNPIRTGGGVSMALALYAGLPVLVAGVSDAKNFLNGIGVFKDIESQFIFLEKCIVDNSFLKDFRDLQVNYFIENCTSRHGALRLLQECFDDSKQF